MEVKGEADGEEAEGGTGLEEGREGVGVRGDAIAAGKREAILRQELREVVGWWRWSHRMAVSCRFPPSSYAGSMSVKKCLI